MPKSPHTSFKKGTHVFVKLKDGSKFEDQFEDKKTKFVVLRKSGKIPIKDIKAMTFKNLKPFGLGQP